MATRLCLTTGAAGGAGVGGDLPPARAEPDPAGATLAAELNAKSGDAATRYGTLVAPFASAAFDITALDVFLRASVIETTTSDTMRQHHLNGQAASVHLNCAAALQGFLEELGVEQATLRAMLTGTGSRSSSDLLTIFTAQCKKGKKNVRFEGGPAQLQQLHVSVRSESVLNAMGEDDRSEGTYLMNDAEKIAKDTESITIMRKLDDLARANMLPELKIAVDNSGVHLAAILNSSSDFVTRIAEQHQWSGEMLQCLRNIRLALDKSVWISVGGSAAAQPSLDYQKGFKFLRNG